MKNQILEEFIDHHNQWISAWINDPDSIREQDVYFKHSPKCSLEFNALPEPYLGDPYKCSAVIININPGGSMSKYQSLATRENKLNFISRFIDGHNYHNFAVSFPYLTLPESECGTDWWTSRNSWINRISGNTNELKRPFAMEICPWHSKSWKGLDFEQEELRNYLEEYVIRPAQEAIKNSNLRIVGLSVGTPITKVLESCGYKRVKLWGWDNTEKKFRFDTPISDKWPQKEDNKPVKRTYTLWRRENSDVYFLNTSAQGGNRAPSINFLEVEKEILASIKN